MKRCPECRRDYTDDTLSYCLADGAALVYGLSDEEPATALLSETPESARGLPTGKARNEVTKIQRAETEPDAGVSPLADKQSAPANRTVKLLLFGGISALVLIVGFFGYLSYKPETKQIRSIAVLPFENASTDTDSEYLSDGVTESLINSFSRLPNVRVVPRLSAFHYKGKELDIKKIAGELNVESVLTGRIVQRGDTLDISVDLIDAANNAQMWGQHYIRKASDILRVQDEIAQQVTDTLRVRLTGEQQAQIAKRSTENAEAYQLYLKGRYHLNKQTGDDFRASLTYFQQAIDVDPNYARAYAGLADDYCFAADFYLSNTEAYTKARAAAAKALEIDDNLAEGHAAMGTVEMFYDWNWPGAETELKRAIELDPNYALTYEIYSLLLGVRGQPAEGVTAAKQAQQLDPLSLYANAALVDALIRAGQFDEATAQLHKVFDLDRNWWWAHIWAAQIYERKNQLTQSVAEAEMARQSEINPLVIGKLGRAYALAGNRVEAQKMINDLKEMSKQTYVPSSLLAEIYTALGDRDNAIKWLEKGHEERDAGNLFLKVDPIWDSMRSDPRFAALVKDVGL